jgi:hypothetical protein
MCSHKYRRLIKDLHFISGFISGLNLSRDVHHFGYNSLGFFTGQVSPKKPNV